MHTGFSNIQAVSRSGRSMPFFKAADGLIPAQGAGFFTLMRLSDAIKENKDIYGVIKAISLTNDGRGHGLLVPAKEGQVKAMLKAYELAKLNPSDIELVECHATATPVGDNMEAQAMKEIFKESIVNIASIKSNIGHTITASGVAAAIKVLKAFENNLMPASLGEGELIDEFKDSKINVLRENKEWKSKGSKKAGVSNFGFGGNNAHMILEEYKKDNFKISIKNSKSLQNKDIAIVGLGVIAANVVNLEDFIISMFKGESRLTELKKDELLGLCKQIDLPLFEIKFPPNDIRQTLPQQLMLLKTARDALKKLKKYDKEKTGIYAGMQTDCTGVQFGIACRFIDWANKFSSVIDVENIDINRWIDDSQNIVCPYQTVAGALGIIPNNVANRISNNYDFRSSSFTISSEELSGLTALNIAIRSLRAKELDTALVGAVDVCSTYYHIEAAKSILDKNKHIPGDIAVTLVLKRLEDARKDGDKIYSIITDRMKREPDFIIDSEGDNNFINYYGYSHCASTLLDILAATLVCSYKSVPSFKGKKATPYLPTGKTFLTKVNASAKYNGSESIIIKEDEKAIQEGLFVDRLPDMFIFKGSDRREVKAHLESFNKNGDGASRLVLLVFEKEFIEEAKNMAASLLEKKENNITFSNNKYGIYYYDKPISGEIAFVFAGAAAAYKGMGSELLMAYPFMKEGISEMFPELNSSVGWIYNEDEEPDAEKILWGATLISQVHAFITRNQLNIKPNAAIGYSSGESNSLMALGAWTDLENMFYEFKNAKVLTEKIGGKCEVIKKAWEDKGVKDVEWVNYWIMAPIDEIKKEAEKEDLVHLTMINSPDDAVISGQREICEKIAKKFGANRYIKLPYDVANHCPELNYYAKEWWEFHHRETNPISDIRFYTSSTGSYYYPTDKNAADAILGMATKPLNFPLMIENAYKDGVRIFIEHGPRDACSRWIERILSDKRDEIVIVSLDKPNRSSAEQVFYVIAELLAAGVEFEYENYFEHFKNIDLRSQKEILDPKKKITVDVYKDLPKIPPIENYIIEDKKQFLYEEVYIDDVQVDEPLVLTRAPKLPYVQEKPMKKKRPVKKRDYIGVDLPIFNNLFRYNEHILNIHKNFAKKQKAFFDNYLAYRNKSLEILEKAIKSNRFRDLAFEKEDTSKKEELLKTDDNKITYKKDEFSKSKESKAKEEKEVKSFNYNKVGASKGAKISKEELRKLAFKPLPVKKPVGPKFNKEQLKIHACGNISEIFGPKFKEQDKYELQVRMPMPPLLLADRVTGIEGEQFVLGSGSLWTETDILEGQWYLIDDYIPPGIIMESGQADLMLTSWQGIDILNNKGNRVYRLLGADVMYYGKAPKVGDTLCFQIEILNYISFGEIKMFNFQYDCRIDNELILSVRNAQAGFFTYAELESSGGVIWNPEEAEFTPNPRLDPPVVKCTKNKFSDDDIKALTEGRVYDCFGQGYEKTKLHEKSPTIPKGRMNLVDRVTHFDISGGPFKRGYIRAEYDVTPDKWFLDCHFYKDPCMPGTLMADGALQVIAIYMIGLGYTLDKDGWYFEPVAGEPYKLLARGQITKERVKLVYEVFIEEVVNGDCPTIYADVLGSNSRGLKIFHARRMALKLSPGQ
ncbi:MAG: beta-ketoacyl synthase N-terminal-like domain-containing protein [Deferribacterota bacterium]|nr:beta-ketoacyl synthase N-terminal-like domain-containing protein [Deferribacterota bacterium]